MIFISLKNSRLTATNHKVVTELTVGNGRNTDRQHNWAQQTVNNHASWVFWSAWVSWILAHPVSTVKSGNFPPTHSPDFIVCCHLSPTLDKFIFFNIQPPFFEKLRNHYPSCRPRVPSEPRKTSFLGNLQKWHCRSETIWF